MVAVLERTYERSVRVRAPWRVLYGLMDSAENLVRFVPQVESHRATTEDGPVVVCGHLSLGPVRRAVEATLSVDATEPPNRIDVTFLAPSIPLELRGVFHFSVAAAEETTLVYSAMVRTDHPMVRRMRSTLIGVVEEHVDSTTDRVAILGRQHAEAERRFSELLSRGE